MTWSVRDVVRQSLQRGRRVARSRQRDLARAVRTPGRERDDLLQVAKSAAAAVLAWQVARLSLHSDQPFLAPLAALITVHATVYQSVRGAAQHVLAVLAGVILAFLAARALGVEWYSVGLVLVAALLVARRHRLGDSGLQVPTTALLAMTIAGGVQETALEARVVETLVGGVIGAAMNLLVRPPVHLRSGREAVATTASGVAWLLRSVAEGIRGEWSEEDARDWLERARRLDGLVRDARSTTEQGREGLRGAVRSGGDKWRDLRSQIQQVGVQRPDSMPSYGSLLVDAERILDELERAEGALAGSTP